MTVDAMNVSGEVAICLAARTILGVVGSYK